MPNKTITKIGFVVIFIAFVSFIGAACIKTGVSGGTPPEFDSASQRYGPPRSAGKVQSDEITESSGLAVSRCQEDLLWTHNDSGDGPYIFAMDGQGRTKGTWKVANAENVDWEDISMYRDPSGRCFLFVADTGNGRKNPRTGHKIYKVPEPAVRPEDANSSRKQPLVTAPAEVLTFVYPDGWRDSEALLVDPAGSDIYVITKERNKPASIYKIKPLFGGPLVTAEHVSDVTVPAIPNGFITGGDISPDGGRVVLCDYFAAYEFDVPAGSDLGEVWRGKPSVVNLGDREQGESIAYSADGGALYATSEKKNQPLLVLHRVKP